METFFRNVADVPAQLANALIRMELALVGVPAFEAVPFTNYPDAPDWSVVGIMELIGCQYDAVFVRGPTHYYVRVARAPMRQYGGTTCPIDSRDRRPPDMPQELHVRSLASLAEHVTHLQVKLGKGDTQGWPSYREGTREDPCDLLYRYRYESSPVLYLGNVENTMSPVLVALRAYARHVEEVRRRRGLEEDPFTALAAEEAALAIAVEINASAAEQASISQRIYRLLGPYSQRMLRAIEQSPRNSAERIKATERLEFALTKMAPHTPEQDYRNRDAQVLELHRAILHGVYSARLIRARQSAEQDDCVIALMTARQLAEIATRMGLAVAANHYRSEAHELTIGLGQSHLERVDRLLASVIREPD